MSLITSPPSFVLSRPPGHPPWPASSNSFCRRSRSCSAFSARTFHASCETSSRSTALTASLSAPTSLIASSPILRVCSAVSTSAPRYRTSRPRPRPTAAPRSCRHGPCPPLGPTLDFPRCRLPLLAVSSSLSLHRSRNCHVHPWAANREVVCQLPDVLPPVARQHPSLDQSIDAELCREPHVILVALPVALHPHEVNVGALHGRQLRLLCEPHDQ